MNASDNTSLLSVCGALSNFGVLTKTKKIFFNTINKHTVHQEVPQGVPGYHLTGEGELRGTGRAAPKCYLLPLTF